MATTLFRNCALRSAVRAAPVQRAAIGGTTFTRGKATLPDLSCTYLAPLKPRMSAKKQC